MKYDRIFLMLHRGFDFALKRAFFLTELASYAFSGND